MHVADSLGYRRPRRHAGHARHGDGTAEPPARRRSGLVGVVTSDYNGRFSLPLLTGAESTLGAARHAALLMSSHGRTELERSHIDLLAVHGVDGLIIVGDTTNPRPRVPDSVTMGLPIVYAYDPSSDPNDCSVICDNAGAGRQAIEYLLGIGRRRIAVVGGSHNFQATRDRMEGALATFRLYGIAPARMLSDQWSENWGERAAALLDPGTPAGRTGLAGPADGPVDAVYCLNDEIARGMVRGLMARGLRVPQDVAVVGHDD